jgi:hypothetical protein
MRAVYLARDYINLRAQDLLDGDNVDWSLELPRLKIVIGELVAAGVVEPSDWLFEAPLVSQKIKDFAKCRQIIEGRILARVVIFNPVEKEIFINMVPVLGQLVFEMAAAVLCHEIMVESVSNYLNSSARTRYRMIAGRDALLHDLRNAMGYLSPEEHMRQAQEALSSARRECAKARKRLDYERSRGGEGSKEAKYREQAARVAVEGLSCSQVRERYRIQNQDLFSTDNARSV